MSGDAAAPRLLRFADARRLRWRNGGGETAEVAAHPPGAGPDAFGWRVSLATIADEGPFSSFHGVDRTLTLLDGDGLVLAVGSGPPVRLDAGSAPLRFAGEAPCRCSLVGGPATALNVMVERRSFGCAVARLGPGEGLPRVGGAATLLVCAEGEIATDLGTLGRADALLLPAGAGVGFDAASARALAVSLWRLPPPPAGGG